METVAVALLVFFVAVVIAAIVFYLCWHVGRLKIRASLTASLLIATILLLIMLPLFSFLNTSDMFFIFVLYALIILLTLAVIISYLAVRIAEDKRMELPSY